jgi:transcription elongation factor Elf1
MSQTSKIQRVEVYKDHRVQLLLSKFISGEIKRIDPVFDYKYGYKYPVVEAIVGSPSDVDVFLKQLFKERVLERELYDKILHCPSCNSANVSVRYRCPYCESFDVKKGSLIEHVPCGYIDTEERFQTDDKLVCPRCNKELTKMDKDYRKAGVWCTCNECDKSFDIPTTSHFCRDCHKDFMFEDAIYKDVYSYTLSAQAMKEASLGWVLIAPIRKFLETHGYEVKSPGHLKGASGASHRFDITASRETIPKNVIVFDLAASNDDAVTEQPIIAMFAKIYDVAPDKACVVTVPKINENGKKLAVLYKIDVIEAKDQKGVLEALETLIT